MLIPVILSGGAGTRLWPVSREDHPKPFMQMPDGLTLLHKTLARACALPEVHRTLTVTNEQHYFHSRDLYREVSTSRPMQHDFLLEPQGRNTAPAIAMAVHWALQQADDPVLLVLPADHLIENLDEFKASVAVAVSLARKGYLVTFGIGPTRPDTGFGYIEKGLTLSGGFIAKKFVEKPDLQTAKAYLESGQYFWNAGMFCATARALIDAFQVNAPELAQAATDLAQRTDWRDTPVRFRPEDFEALPAVSIDYAVMEKASNVAIVPATFDWSDIGNWDAISALTLKDAHGNRSQSQEALFVNSHNCYAHGRERVMALVGLEDVMVIDTPDALLVMHRNQVQQVKEAVATLKARAHPTHLTHNTVHRPWGTYTVLETAPGFKIKRIVVKPGAALSLQKHEHRSEHWVVISGEAMVTNGELETHIQANQSAYIPAGTLHRLHNPGQTDCVMIEVQVGGYVGEDDIIRFDDVYGRSSVGQLP